MTATSNCFITLGILPQCMQQRNSGYATRQLAQELNKKSSHFYGAYFIKEAR